MSEIINTFKIVILGIVAAVGMVVFSQVLTTNVGALSDAAYQACLGGGGQPQRDDGSEVADIAQASAATQCVHDGNSTGPLFGPDSLFEVITKTLIFVIGAAAVIFIIIGAARYVLSSGDANAVQGAKNTIMYALIGLVLAIAAYGIVDFIVSRL